MWHLRMRLAGSALRRKRWVTDLRGSVAAQITHRLEAALLPRIVFSAAACPILMTMRTATMGAR